MPYILSRSALDLFLECPRCFWVKIRKGIKRPEMIFPSLPGGVDRILKKHFDSFRQRGELPPEIGRLEVAKKDELTLFENEGLLAVWRNNRKGIRWRDESGNELFGAVDDILKKGSKLIVLDYKTRGSPLKESPDYYQSQLSIYALLLKKNGYEIEDYAYLLFYHPVELNEKGEVVFQTELVKMPVDVKKAEKTFSDALRTLELDDVPEPNKECKYCGWLKTCGI